MNKNIIKLLLATCFLVLSNCGFKVVNKSLENNFFIQQINTTGDKRISFIIKNNLLLNSQKNNQKKLLVKLDVKKNKTIKEKNIKNEITKNQISINIEVKIIQLSNNEEIKFSVNTVGDYSMEDSYSLSLNNERKLVENLAAKLSKEILKQFNIRIK
tara:strand:- start:49 stop:519 length:471 start_codon:yes stop_codon:yes gene_type:complete